MVVTKIKNSAQRGWHGWDGTSQRIIPQIELN
uniref:Uncharacterized protein n=1 Tax=Arundo donax TaxID=35708 RepID=A0A0A8ZMH6_ARUDO